MTASKKLVLPEVPGPHGVGTTSRHLIDENRQETRAESESGPRELMVQIWYPSTSTDAHATYPYAPEFWEMWKYDMIKLCEQHNIDQKYLDFFDEGIDAHAQPDAPLQAKEGGYPVLLFSHGMGMLRTSYTTYCAGLASHGYVVIGIGHTYGTDATIFPDGRVLRFRDLGLKDVERKRAIELIEREHEVWVNDILFVQNSLNKLNESGPLQGAFDLTKIGTAGHSFGGSAAVNACRISDKISACMNIDGNLIGPNEYEGFAKACMVIQAAGSSHDPLAFPALCNAVRKEGGVGLQAAIYGSDPGAFGDWALIRELPLYREHEKLFHVPQHALPGERMIALMRACMADFFDAYLKGTTDKLGRMREYPEVGCVVYQQ